MPETPLHAGLRLHQLPTLSGLRAIAVFLVIFYHCGFEWVPGGLGVLMFFVISGFLITWLLLKENSRRGTVSLRRFYARRALRIGPAFYAYALLTLVLLKVLHKPIPWPSAVAALLYVENYMQAWYGDPGTGFSHTWSLAIEEQFYLLWPLLFLTIRTRLALLIRVPAAIIVTVWIYRAVLKFGLHVWQGYFYEAFDTRLDHLLIGCLLAVLLYSARDHRVWQLLCGRLWLAGVTVGLLVVSVMAENQYKDVYRDSVGFIVNPLLCAVLIPQLISLRDSWLVRWLEWPPVRYLGTISYSLYLYQQLVLTPVAKMLGRTPFALQVAGSVAFLIAVASASYFVIEKPFLRLKNSQFRA